MLVGQEIFCDYSSIQEAVNALEALPAGEPETLVILQGVYEENVQIYRSDLTVVGLGHVEIRGSRYARQRDEAGEEIGTFGTPTLFLGGRRLLLSNLTVTNTAGAGEAVGQALAVYANCDEAVFRGCTFKGHQDTLFTGPLPLVDKRGFAFGGVPLRERHEQYRQLYQDCRIEGTVDFIFGGAAAYFERCEIRSLRRDTDSPSYVTAASTPEGQAYGYVFRDCFFTAEEGVREVYLGRPWRGYAKTELDGCRLGGHIHPLGWDNWGNPDNEQTVTYREYGVAADDLRRTSRTSWTQLPDAQAKGPAPAEVFAGTDFWRDTQHPGS
ncbi:pectinesterase family protein [Paenibacillus tengchongensis]|uniref:pectinesterase family protein n=1 Tax=Paenibacillus tengchongensis TaxID=2608684 RepID=UPI00124D65B5|nr:pectinesterase family protein [Paenibacillus tengchongensis]